MLSSSFWYIPNLNLFFRSQPPCRSKFTKFTHGPCRFHQSVAPSDPVTVTYQVPTLWNTWLFNLGSFVPMVSQSTIFSIHPFMGRMKCLGLGTFSHPSILSLKQISKSKWLFFMTNPTFFWIKLGQGLNHLLLVYIISPVFYALANQWAMKKGLLFRGIVGDYTTELNGGLIVRIPGKQPVHGK